ncbi:hypothetical protein PybrP1_011564 [[Pythium] brassicae (nom. inval.)]|nr:hypothetical protein PybrP1_011564 [[Pythium] brassicae (nom. inval.)]
MLTPTAAARSPLCDRIRMLASRLPVAEVDELIIALQAMRKKDFLDPLSWDLAPHPAILATVEAVLLLFDIPTASASSSALWNDVWGLWIVKNIDAHSGGWEWVATNEPTGLFTKPYALCPDHLERVEQLLAFTQTTPSSHQCWTRMRAYAGLRDWAAACAKYVHMTHHCLPSFPAYADVQKLIAPPQRTPQANVWFRLESAEGVAYYYNRLLQDVALERPADFDGAHVTTIPSVIQELIQDALQRDVATRLELERRSRQRAREQLLAEDEWIECIDTDSQRPFYYSLKHYRVMWTPPERGAFIPCIESVAFAAVLCLQAAYRRRRLALRVQAKRTKRSSLPMFSAFSTAKQREFFS